MPSSEGEEWLNSIKDCGTRLRLARRKSIHCMSILRKRKLPHWTRLERRKRSQEVEEEKAEIIGTGNGGMSGGKHLLGT